MSKKYFLLLPLTVALLSTQATYANRCLDFIDKRVNNDTLDLELCGLLANDMPTVVSYLNQHPNIKKLNMSYNFDMPFNAYSQLLDTQITDLELKGDPFFPQDGIDAATAKMLAASKTIQHLDLSDNNVGNEGASALTQDTNLTWLSLYDNGLTDASATSFANNTTITHLDLSNNLIDDDGAKILATNKHIQELFVGGWMKEAGVMAIAQMPQLNTFGVTGTYNLSSNAVYALAHNPNLKNLSFVRCWIGDAGAEVLSNDTKLETLNLDNNQLTDNGISYLSKLTNLTKLNLQENDFDDKAANEIAKLTKLTDLNFGGGTPKFTGDLVKVIAKLPNLQHLYLNSAQNMNDDAAIAIANNSSLQSVSGLNAYGFSKKAFIALGNSKLTKLELEDVDKPSKSSMQALLDNKHLQELHFDYSKLDSDAFDELAKSKNIPTLILYVDSVTNKQAKTLLKNTHFKVLNVNFNYIDDKIIPDVLANSTLDSLDIGNNNMTQAGVDKLLAESHIAYLEAWTRNDFKQHLNDSHYIQKFCQGKNRQLAICMNPK